MGKDYYAILGVPRDVESDALKKAYRKLAMRWHPDKNPDNVAEAQAKFQEISEAYDVLSDPDKRRVYNQLGEEGLKGGAGPGGTYTFTSTDAEEIFRRFSGAFGGDPFAGFFGSGRSRRAGGFPFGFFSDDEPAPAAAPLEIGVSCSLEQLFTGTTKRLKVTRTVLGREEEKIIELEIRPGWKQGTKITYPGDGNQLRGQPPQDLVFVIKELKHAVFVRDRDDLVANLEINLKEALCGFTLEQRGIDGEMLRLNIDSVIEPASERRFRGKGMPKKGGGRGDLIVRFAVKFPTALTHKQKAHIATILDG
jgi:DnaJ-class molecular chaperone